MSLLELEAEGSSYGAGPLRMRRRWRPRGYNLQLQEARVVQSCPMCIEESNKVRGLRYTGAAELVLYHKFSYA